jgi:hypothetical protein
MGEVLVIRGQRAGGPAHKAAPRALSSRLAAASTNCIYMDAVKWDENKRLRTLARHGIDFGDAGLVFDGRPIITTRSRLRR